MKNIDFSEISKRVKRSYKRSPAGIHVHMSTARTKRKLINDALIYDLILEDEDIHDMIENELIYIGEISNIENKDYELFRDLRTILCSLILKMYYEGNIIADQGDFEIEILHWGDGTKLLGSGFFVAAILIRHNPDFFSDDPKILKLLQNWMPYYLGFISETKSSLTKFMEKRKPLMNRLLKEFKLNNNLSVSFRIIDYVGDLSHLWKLFLINSSFCAHCLQKYELETELLKTKIQDRRNISNILKDSKNGCNGVDSGVVVVSEFEEKHTPSTVCDVLHTTKGAIDQLEKLMEEVDGISSEIITELKESILIRNDVSCISGGLTRFFLLNYKTWLPKLEEKLVESSKTKRRQEITERFKYSKHNLEWILFLQCQICKIVYSSSNEKTSFRIIFLEVVSMFLYLALRSRYGLKFLNKHFHGLIVHLPQDYARISQRKASCERGEYLLSVLKRVSETESNRTQENALVAMILSLEGNTERLLNGEDEPGYKEFSKKFNDIVIEDCNFELDMKVVPKHLQNEVTWFCNDYLKDYSEFIEKDYENSEIIKVRFIFSKEWNFCHLKSDKLCLDIENIPKVESTEKISGLNCGCGKKSNQKCSFQKCVSCCHIHQHLGESHVPCKCTNHYIDSEMFLKTYKTTRTTEGMKASSANQRKKDEKQELILSIIEKLETKKRKRADLDGNESKKLKNSQSNASQEE